MSSALSSEDICSHLKLSREMAAASQRYAEENPELARELRDESREIMAFVARATGKSDVRAPFERLGASPGDDEDIDEPKFQRFRTVQKSVVPPPDDGPFAERSDQLAKPDAQTTELVTERLATLVTRCWLAFLRTNVRFRTGGA